MHLDKSLYNSGLKNLVVPKWDQLHSLLRNIRIQYPLTASCASKVLKLQLPFCLSDPLFYSTSSTVVFYFPSRFFLILTSWLFDHFNFTVFSRFFIVLCFHNLNVVPTSKAMFSFCKETWSPISRWKVGPVATEAAAKHKYPARKPVIFSQNRLFWMLFCLRTGCLWCFFS